MISGPRRCHGRTGQPSRSTRPAPTRDPYATPACPWDSIWTVVVDLPTLLLQQDVDAARLDRGARSRVRRRGGWRVTRVCPGCFCVLVATTTCTNADGDWTKRTTGGGGCAHPTANDQRAGADTTALLTFVGGKISSARRAARAQRRRPRRWVIRAENRRSSPPVRGTQQDASDAPASTRLYRDAAHCGLGRCAPGAGGLPSVREQYSRDDSLAVVPRRAHEARQRPSGRLLP
jgi:hypothetical protein